MNELDYLLVLEFARIGAAAVPDTIMDALDLPDAEFVRVRDLIHEALEVAE